MKLTVKRFFEFLDGMYPTETACDFDNVGLLVGNGETEITSVLVCLDCDMTAVRRAAELGCNLILTHHPVIFDGVKRLPFDGVLASLVKNDIAVISMHTNLDIAREGVTATLCRAIGLDSFEPFKACDGFTIYGAQAVISDPHMFAKHLKSTLGGFVKYTAGRDIKRLLVCSGSGGNYIDDAVNGGFDALVTAEVKHHQFLAAANAGISVFDAGHFQTENLIVPSLCKKLEEILPQIKFFEYSPEIIRFV